jgi:hypothetical protein
MPRLRNSITGVVVNVSDEKAARLGATFVPVEAPTKAPAKKASSRKSSK